MSFIAKYPLQILWIQSHRAAPLFHTEIGIYHIFHNEILYRINRFDYVVSEIFPANCIYED